MTYKYVKGKSKASKGRIMRKHGYKASYTSVKGPHPEMKYTDVALNPFTVTTAGATQLFNGLTKGTEGVAQRIGNRIQSKYIKMFGDVYTTDNSAAMTRIIVFYDKQTNGAIPVTGTMLMSASPYANYVQELKRHRIVPIYDKMFYTDSEFKNKQFHLSKRLNFMTEYYSGGNTGLITDIQKGSLVMLAISSNANARLTLTARFFYSDN